jgi:hypothetical protein
MGDVLMNAAKAINIMGGIISDRDNEITRLRAENAKLSGLNAQYLAALETFEAMMSNPKYDAGEVLEEFATITRAALNEEKSK